MNMNNRNNKLKKFICKRNSRCNKQLSSNRKKFKMIKNIKKIKKIIPVNKIN
jgi:hypothetical protein